MSKFNLKNTIKTTNRSGHAAYSMPEKEQLVTAVLTSMFGEPKYYGSTDNDIVRLATACAGKDPSFISKLACYARNVGNMRSVSHVLTAVTAREFEMLSSGRTISPKSCPATRPCTESLSPTR